MDRTIAAYERIVGFGSELVKGDRYVHYFRLACGHKQYTWKGMIGLNYLGLGSDDPCIVCLEGVE